MFCLIYRPVVLCLLLTLFFSRTSGQAKELSTGELIEKADLFAKANPDHLLFLHLDKTLYTNNEQMWFCAYLVRSADTSEKHNLLSVALIDPLSSKVLLKNKFEMRGWTAYGSLTLPDSIAPGDYQFIAYTNITDTNGRPVALFSQSVTIKSITQQSFKASLTLLDSQATNGRMRARISVMPDNLKDKARPTVEYSIDKKTTRHTDLDKQNVAIIPIPQEQLNQSNPVLLASVKYKNQVQYLNVALPENRPPGILIRFYPEGGSLTDGLESTVSLESTTLYKQPVAIKGVLYKDGQPFDTITTGAYGIGRFRLRPKSNSLYQFKVLANSYLKKDSLYLLPASHQEGIALRVRNAIVRDTLRITLFSTKSRKASILVHHNYKDIYASADLDIKTEGNNVIFALNEIPRGIATITVIDEAGRPLAERLFFAHYDQKINVGINSTKDAYGKKEKVDVRIKLSDHKGNLPVGILSVACVQENRLESRKKTDIETYTYLNHELDNLPSYSDRKLDNEEYLENILLARGWRRYTWQDMAGTKAKDTLIKNTALSIRGRVLFRGRKIKNPVEISVLRNKLIIGDLITSTDDGSFELTRDNLLTEEGENILLSVNEKKNDEYSIEIDDPYAIINQKIADSTTIQEIGTRRTEQSTTEQTMKGMEQAVILKEVVVTGSKNNSIYGTKAKGSNACGDYVDASGYLNWPGSFNSPLNHPPVKGTRYISGTHYTNSNGEVVPYFQAEKGYFTVAFIVYDGCTTDVKSSITRLSGIYMAKEFYSLDEESLKLPYPQYISTIFWKAGVMVNNQGEADCSFFTGDITGRFRIVVQGITDTDVFFGEKTFTVQDK